MGKVGFSRAISYCPCCCWPTKILQVTKGLRGSVSSLPCYPHQWCVLPGRCDSGRLDINFSLTCSGFFLWFAVINDASNCCSTHTYGITAHRMNTFQSWAFLSLGQWSCWSSYAKLGFDLYRLWSLSLPAVPSRWLFVHQRVKCT